MEMGIGIIITAIMSALSALCSVACLVVLLIKTEPEEEENGRSRTPAPTEPAEKTKNDVEKRRRAAVKAREHRNFMDYDGTPQQPIDPALILGE